MIHPKSRRVLRAKTLWNSAADPIRNDRPARLGRGFTVILLVRLDFDARGGAKWLRDSFSSIGSERGQNGCFVASGALY